MFFVFPQQRKLMGSSAQNSSGVHCCRRRVRFNRGSGEGSGEGLGGLGAKPGQVQQGSEEGSGKMCVKNVCKKTSVCVKNFCA